MAKILIVDDDPSIQSILGKILKMKGHEGVAAESGMHALELIVQSPFDLVITDLRMPQMNGLEVLQKVKALKPGLPVIMVTAYASSETVGESIQLGVFDYLAKPFKVSELIETVERALAADNDHTRVTDGYTGNTPSIKAYLASAAPQASAAEAASCRRSPRDSAPCWPH